MSGLTAAIGVITALYERTFSGKGQHIDLSLFDVGMMALIEAGMDYLSHGNVQTRSSSVHRPFAPMQPFLTADGWVTLTVGTDDQFRRVCRAMELIELTDDSRFTEKPSRLADQETLAKILPEAFARRPRDYRSPALASCAVPLSSVNDIAEAYADPQSVARNMVLTYGETYRSYAPSPGQSASAHEPHAGSARWPTAAPQKSPVGGLHIFTTQLGFPWPEIAVLMGDRVSLVVNPAAQAPA